MMLRSAASPGSWGRSAGMHVKRFLVPLLLLADPQSGAAVFQTAAPFPFGAASRPALSRAKNKGAGLDSQRLWKVQRSSLLDLRFLEFDMLLGDRIVLGLGHLVGHGAAVLRGDVEEAGVSRRQQLDLDGRSFRHGGSASDKNEAADAEGPRRNLARNYKSRPKSQPRFGLKTTRQMETRT